MELYKLCGVVSNARSISFNRDSSYIISDGTTKGDIEDEIKERYGKDVYIEEITMPLIEYSDGYEIGGRISTARDRAIKQNYIHNINPVCIFRDTDFLKLDEMQKENPSIKFGRVIKTRH